MEKFLRIFSKEYGNINQAAILLGFFAFLSQVMGLLRDKSFAHFIGLSSSLDTYYAAFRIPDLIFISIASLASITVLIPFLNQKMQGEDGKAKAEKFLSDVFTVFFSVIFLVSVLFFAIMPHLAFFIAPGFSPEMQAKVIVLSRIMLLSPILMGLSNLFGTVTQLYRRFFIYSLSPIFYNFGIILGVIFFYPFLGINGLACGVVLGALMHFLIQFFASRRCGLQPRLSRRVDFRDIRKAVITSLPRTLGLAFNSIALICIVAFASSLKAGSISVFNLAYNLQSSPLNIIGISYAVAAFPTLAKSASMGAMDEFKKNMKSTARQIVFWSIPVTFLFIVLRAQIVRVLLGSGSFSWDNTRLVAASLAIFSLSMLAQAMIALLSRAYYATGDTKRPLTVNFLCSIFIVILAYTFIHLYKEVVFFRYFIESLLKVSDIPGTEILMLPLAYSCGTILNFILHWYFVRRDFMQGDSFITRTFFQSLGGSFFVGGVAYFFLNIFSPIFGTTTFWGVFLQGLFSGLLGIMAGILILHLLKSEELEEFLRSIRGKFWKSKAIPPLQEEL